MIKKTLRILTVAFMIALLIVPLFSNTISATTPTLQENLLIGGDAASATHIYGSNVVGMQFTSLVSAHSLTSIGVGLYRVGSPGYINISLYTAAAGVPVTELTSVTYNGNNLGTAYSSVIKMDLLSEYFSMSGSTQYAVVVSAPYGDSSNYVLWEADSGGGLADAVGSHSTDGGYTWASDSPVDYLFGIWGNVSLSIVSVKAFQHYLTSGDLLITAEVINNYPPYASSSLYDPTQLFAVQLLDLTGTNVLASVPLVSWGDFPESIYLSPSSVSSLTIGGAYIFRVIGTFSPYPSVTYALTSGDWQGDMVSNNYVYFNQWVKATAQNMELTYQLDSGTLISLLTGGGWTLTSSGGAYFTESIPGIMSVEPSLFQYAKSRPQFAIGTDQSVDAGKTSAQIETEFEIAVGTQVAGIANTFGGLFGIPGFNFMGYVLEGLILAVVLIGLFAGEGAGALAIMIVAGVPILFYGNYIHAIGIQWTLVFAATMLFLFVRQFYWKTT